MNAGRVHFSKDGQTAQILFDNVGAHNALTESMWRELADHSAAAAADRDLRVVTFRGAGGKAFISGNDISGFIDFETGEQGVAYEREVGAYVAAIEEMPQATVAIVEGWAVGGGLAIALACDFRIARTGSRFGSPIGRTIGNCLAAQSYARIVAHVGPSLAKRMILLGEFIEASQLHQLGILQDVVDAQDLDAAATSLVDRLLVNAPLTIASSKEAIRRLVYQSLPDIDDLISSVYASEDFKSGVASFVAKQKPRWRGQ